MSKILSGSSDPVSLSKFDQGGGGAALCDADGEVLRAVACIREHDLHADGLKGELREVVFLAEVAQENALQMIVEDFAQELAAAGIGQVAALS